MKPFIALPVLAMLLIAVNPLFGQGVSINPTGSSADPSAILDVNSSSQGILFPRLSLTEIQALTAPANGLVVFCTSDNNFYVFLADSVKWKSLSFGASSIIPTACGIPFLDSRDGKLYNTVLIGTQCWMKENLNYGTMLPFNTPMTNDGIVHKYCYGETEDTCAVYGGLYIWDEAMNWTTSEGAQGICPAGFHIPTDNEFMTLEGNVDSQYGVGHPVWWGTEFRGSDAGLNLKSTSRWVSPGNGLDLFGFTARPGGGLYIPPNYYDMGYVVYYWTSTQQDEYWKWYRLLYYSSSQSYRNVHEKQYGYSIRCLRDQE